MWCRPTLTEESGTELQFGWALIARVIYLLRTHTRLPFGPYLSWVFHQLRERERWGRKRTLKYVHRRKPLQALSWAEQCVIRAAWGNDAVAEFSSHRVSSVGYITLYVCPSHSFSHFLPPSLHSLSFSPWRSAVITLHYLFQSHWPVPLRGKPPIPPSYRGTALGTVPTAYMRVLKLQYVCVCLQPQWIFAFALWVLPESICSAYQDVLWWESIVLQSLFIEFNNSANADGQENRFHRRHLGLCICLTVHC